ncbi:hypothetical protein V5E97_23925 [Singulisphaera sp. Ch08]|uniref:Uncharacterized protein n=1 Tax=Singulisphaera sp. Ch08 TaxID=3120278 RepID=A0AAU7C9F0_9BACT
MVGKRFTIAGLMGTVVLAAAGLAAFRSGSLFALRLFYTLTIVILLLATLAARLCREEMRAFWFGFATFGWVYVILALGLKPGMSPESLAVQPSLFTNEFLLSAEYVKKGHAFLREHVPSEELTGPVYSIAIGHLVVALGFAAVGGLTTFLFDGGQSRREGARAEVVPPDSPGGKRRRGRLLALGGVVTLVSLLGFRLFWGSTYGPYFPDLVFTEWSEKNEILSQWYGRHLEAMREPSLWKVAESGDDDLIYRMSRLPLYGHPFSIRVVKSGETITLTLVELDGNVGYEPGAISIHRTLRLAPHHWDGLIRRLEQVGYWETPTCVGNAVSDKRPELVIEGVSPGRYHVVIRHDAEENALSDVYRYLVELSGIEVDGLEPSGFH